MFASLVAIWPMYLLYMQVLCKYLHQQSIQCSAFCAGWSYNFCHINCRTSLIASRKCHVNMLLVPDSLQQQSSLNFLL